MLLSGGLDSSSIALSVADHREPGKFAAFNARFSGSGKDESRYAQIAAERAGVPLTMVDFNPDNMLDTLSAVTWHMDSPAVRGQMLARWSLIEAASANATILFEGQGADEMLGGYPHRYYGPYLDSEREHARLSNLPTVLLRTLDVATTRVYLRKLRSRYIKHKQPVGHSRTSRKLLSRRIRELPAYDPGFGSDKPPASYDPLTKRLWQDHSKTMLPYLLHFGDAISMGHSMESRLPFLDHRLVEFVFALPFQQKIRGRKTKYILREALKHKLPAEILQRKRKLGFDVPHKSWIKSAYRDQLRHLVEGSRLQKRDLFDGDGFDL
jgi:asparagine synthase (glutamine-hydrolysing)